METDSTRKIKRLPHKSVPVVCAWCGRLCKISRWEMDERRTHRSHGVCGDCLQRIKEQHEAAEAE